jgi:hypothetical protein
MFLYRNIHWTFPDGNIRNQIDHIFVDTSRYSNVLDIRSLRGDDCHAIHFLVVTEVRERLLATKRGKYMFVDRSNVKKLNEKKGK